MLSMMQPSSCISEYDTQGMGTWAIHASDNVEFDYDDESDEGEYYDDDDDDDDHDEVVYLDEEEDMDESDHTTPESMESKRCCIGVSPEKIFLDAFGGSSAVASLHVKNYFLEHSAKQVEGYDKEFTRAVRDDDVEEVRRLHREEGHLLQVANRFGESIIHMACRRGSLKMLRFLVEEGGASLRVRDDYGRTPLHDAFWTPNPEMELLQYLLEREPEMLWMKDARGFTPLGYVRQEHWEHWNTFLDANHQSLLWMSLRMESQPSVSS